MKKTAKDEPGPEEYLSGHSTIFGDNLTHVIHFQCSNSSRNFFEIS